MEEIFIFVYGTLMRGHRGNIFMTGQKFIGEATLQGYDLYNVSTYPGIIKGTGHVLGEVYKVDEITLNRLDQYEGNGTLYQRTLEDVSVEGKSIKANVYVWLGKVTDKEKVDIQNMPWKKKKI